MGTVLASRSVIAYYRRRLNQCNGVAMQDLPHAIALAGAVVEKVRDAQTSGRRLTVGQQRAGLRAGEFLRDVAHRGDDVAQRIVETERKTAVFTAGITAGSGATTVEAEAKGEESSEQSIRVTITIARE